MAARKKLLSNEEILARFHRLRITIGLSATRFGYMALGNPGAVKQIENGRKLRSSNREKCAQVLDELEREHSIPLKAVREQKENIDIRNGFLEDHKTIIAKSDMED